MESSLQADRWHALRLKSRLQLTTSDSYFCLASSASTLVAALASSVLGSAPFLRMLLTASPYAVPIAPVQPGSPGTPYLLMKSTASLAGPLFSGSASAATLLRGGTWKP